jgi:hypothetical protein
MKTVFGKFGMEPTFHPEFTVPDWATENNWDYWENIVDILCTALRKKKFKHPWWKNAYVDYVNLEIPTTTYIKFSAFKTDYLKLTNFLKKYNTKPSSLLCMDSEGGCHITVSLEKLPKKVLHTLKLKKREAIQNRRFNHGPWDRPLDDTFDVTYRKAFCNNLLTFMAAHPPLVWACLSPNDNYSSTIPLSSFRGIIRTRLYKENFFTVRNKRGEVKQLLSDSEEDRVELRFFMMPRNTKELKFHYDYGNAILHHIKNLTDEKGLIKPKKTVLTTKSYNFTKAKKELAVIFRKLGISYQEYVDLGKEDLLRKRFENGIKWLV